MHRRFLLTLLLAATLPFSGAQALNWSEAVHGDLSNSGAAPTVVVLTEGSNLFEGTMGSLDGTGPLDADVWSFTIAAGYYLTGISLVAYSAPAPNLNSFMALDDAATISMTNPLTHLSNGLWTEQFDSFGDTYTDLLAILDAGPRFGGAGFAGPLRPGTYTFWIQEGDAQIHYTIDMVVTAVPEPGGLALVGLAGMAWGMRRRRPRRQG